MDKPMATWRIWLARAAVLVGLLCIVLGVLVRLGWMQGVTITQFTGAVAAFAFAIFVLLDGHWSS